MNEHYDPAMLKAVASVGDAVAKMGIQMHNLAQAFASMRLGMSKPLHFQKYEFSEHVDLVFREVHL